MTIPITPPKPLPEPIFITTIRGDGHGFFVDVTMNADGYTQKFLGPVDTLFKAQRAERHLLLSWRRWYALWMEDAGSPCHEEMLHQALEQNVSHLFVECELDGNLSELEHREWMERHPLPIPQSETLQ
jgi:hypothetical protein